MITHGNDDRESKTNDSWNISGFQADVHANNGNNPARGTACAPVVQVMLAIAKTVRDLQEQDFHGLPHLPRTV